MVEKKKIYRLNRRELAELSEAWGFSSFYFDKLWRGLYREGHKSFSDFTDLRAEQREILEQNCYFPACRIVKVQESEDRTLKFLFSLEEGELIESVLMEHRFGTSLCLSTQIGCNMACNFCASGLRKKQRDLDAAEMIAQVMTVRDYLEKNGDRTISHLVIMGIGEPFDNYEHLIRFLQIVTDARGLGFGYRHITVSTSGIATRIPDFARQEIRANLAISLHAPNDKLRSQLMPINRVYPLGTLFEAIHEYIRLSNKRVTFEYIMIRDFNDSLKEAEELSLLIEPIRDHAYVNLIPYNPISESVYERSRDEVIAAFFNFLCKKKIRCVIRREHGSDIAAACGQLRSKYLDRTSDRDESFDE